MLFCLFSVFAGVGCSSRKKPFLLGLYDVPPVHFERVARAGFNTVVSTISPEVLERARRQKISVIAHVPWKDRSLLERGSRDPSVRAWYLIDEPDMHLVPPEKVKALRAELRESSRKPALLVLMSGGAVEKYRDSADLVGVDWYPVPWAPVATIAREMRLARLAMRDRPFYAVLQAFDWSSAAHLLRTEAALRPPTAEEMRCMAYLSLMQGASGLLFYTYETESWKIYEHPVLWSALSELAAELKRNAPIFADRVDWWPIQTETHGPPSEMYNEIMDARVLLSLCEVKKPAGAIRAGYYLTAVNTSGSAADFSFKLPFQGVEQFDSSCSPDGIHAEGEWVRKVYAPFEVCIFGPFDRKLFQ